MTAAPTTVAGDHALLERVLAETGASTRQPDPAWADYLQSVAERFIDWFADRLRPLGTLFHLPAEILRVAAWSILALTAAVVVWMLVRLAMRRRLPAGQVLVPRPDAEHVPAPRPAESWADELERRLTAGQPRAALEALWWWLARSLIERGGDAGPPGSMRLAGPAALASWTTRELLGWAGRGDLGGLGRILDRQLYGAAEPAPDEVRTLASRLRAALR